MAVQPSWNLGHLQKVIMENETNKPGLQETWSWLWESWSRESWCTEVARLCSPQSMQCVTSPTSLPKPVTFLGWKVRTHTHTHTHTRTHARTPANSVFSGPITYLFLIYCAFWWKSFYTLKRNREEEKRATISNFVLLFVVFKRHSGSKSSNIKLRVGLLTFQLLQVWNELSCGSVRQSATISSFKAIPNVPFLKKFQWLKTPFSRNEQSDLINPRTRSNKRRQEWNLTSCMFNLLNV